MTADRRVQSFMRKLEQELEDESSFDRLLQQEEEMEAEAFGELAPTGTPTGTRTGAPSSGRCPADSPYVLRGFSQFSDDVRILPDAQKQKLSNIAAEITSSWSASPGSTPIKQIIIVGHADLDIARERRQPGFLEFLSEQRALAVGVELACRMGASLEISVEKIMMGRGARALAVASPRTEAERQCNRRVEITLLRTPQPHLNEAEQKLVHDKLLALNPMYHFVLQGTSGQFENPKEAADKAREIVEKAFLFLDQKEQESKKNTCGKDPFHGFREFFFDALQGTASRFKKAEDVVNHAWEISLHGGFGHIQASRYLTWHYASPQQAMSAECEVVRGMVPGPANHVLCRIHGHVLDTTTQAVIASDLADYRKRFGR